MSQTLLNGGLIETGSLPVEYIAKLSYREGWRPREGNHAHRWFARRFPSAVRSLLLGSVLDDADEFKAAFGKGLCLAGKTVLDPFMGGGTSLMEAQTLGADVIGIDVDAVACAISAFQLKADSTGDLTAALERLQHSTGSELARFYRTESASERVLHYFWVQVVPCQRCGDEIEVHPHYQLAHDDSKRIQWVFCPDCHTPAGVALSTKRHRCNCGLTFDIAKGTADFGVVECRSCKQTERLIEVSRRTKCPTQWKLFALEVLDADHRRRAPLTERYFRAASAFDRRVYSEASRQLEHRLLSSSQNILPLRRIPRLSRSDNRLLQYGYRHYTDLFNTRQLLHLSVLAQAIRGEMPSVKRALAMAFSDHLATNCMMTSYAFGWRRLTPLFSVRAYRHIARPVEINPWLDGTGRGTFPNAVRQVAKFVAARRARAHQCQCDTESSATVIQHDSRSLPMLKSGTVDMVLTDPPYFDNIAYSELSDFFLPWLQFLDVVPENRSAEQGLRRTLAAQGRGAEAASAFGSGLGKALSEVRRVLKANGLVVFTYQHRTAEAWSALATAIKKSNLHVVQVLPMLGNSASGPHVDPGTCQWDAVFVLRKNAPRRSRASGDVIERTTAHWLYWCERLIRNRKPGFKEADQMAFYRACVVGAVGGMFGSTLSESSCKKRLGLSEEHLRSMLKARRQDTGSRHSVSGVAVRRVRDLLGLSQCELADRLGVQETTIRHWERGQSRVRPVASAIIRSLDARKGPKARQRRP